MLYGFIQYVAVSCGSVWSVDAIEHVHKDRESDAPPWLRLESTLLAASRQIRAVYDLAFEPLELNLSQASLLSYVNQFGPQTQTHLAERLALGRAATGTVVDVLEQRGLVERCPDPTDRRVWLVSMTEPGTAIVAEIEAIDTEFRTELRRGISRSDRQQLAAIIVRLQTNLERMTPTYQTAEP